MRKVIVILVVAFIGVVLVGAVYLQMQSAAKAVNGAVKEHATVDRGELVFKVVETGTLDAVRSVDVRTRANGRLKQLLVKEGDIVKAGQLVALIDPLETELRVRQDTAQIEGARSGVQRTNVEIAQRRVTAQAALEQAQSRVRQLEKELGIQPTLTNTSIAQAEAAFNSQVESRKRLLTSTQPSQITASETEVRNATLERDTADREFKRVSDLAGRGYVAQSALDAARQRNEQAANRLAKANTDRERLATQQRSEAMSAEQDVNSAKAAWDRALANRIQNDTKREEYKSAVSALSQARAGLRDVDVLKASLGQGKASVSQLQGMLEDSQRQLRETEVRAPMDGVVSKRYIEEGDMVTGLSAFSQGTAIFRVEDRSALRVKLDINEIDVVRLQNGMKATVDIDAYPDRSYPGKVHKIAPAGNNMQTSAQAAAASAGGDQVVKYQVEVWLDDSDPRLRSGMSAKCTFETLNKQNVLRAPVEFIGKDAEGEFVLIAPPKDSKAQPKRVSVKVGAKTGAFAEIESGVKEGDVLSLRLGPL